MLYNRSQEEIIQVQKEMKEYITYLMNIRKEIRQDVQNFSVEDLSFPTKENPFLFV